jgi:hypothetical protein
MHRRYTPTPRRIIRCWRHHTWGGTVWFESRRRMNRCVYNPSVGSSGAKQKSWHVSVEFKCNRRMNRWSRRRIIRCLSADPDQNCSQTLRRQMNRCLYRRFIWRSILNLLAAELIRRVLKLGRRIIRRCKLVFNSSNSVPLSFPSILLLQPCFHELSELDCIQGTWVCIFYGFWSAWSSY